MIEQLNNEELKHKIDLYVEGQLSAREVDELWAELIQDERYMDYMKSVANLKGIVDKRKETAKVTPLSTYVYYAAAAVVAILVTVFGVINFASQSTQQLISPVDDVELQYYRSSDGTLSSENEEDAVEKAIILANEGNDTQAINLLEGKLQNAALASDKKVELSLTLGSLYYNKAEYSQAIKVYGNVIEQNGQADIDVLSLEKAYWYRGNAYLQKELISEARADMQKAYELNGAYRRVAERYLDALSE
ncbi:tetratricopeptide repeat protein [Fodinibius salsisoli]|uniref:Tetratricopeptide repeat-containing protein n=1 Tax=Fodinibius salsisoli TaxID=2820877 RepID=A0ABT3PPQ9_9BACT|nr:hypothetical protein [Fodinibius salsisoli]MCW9707840.1 hypothetical protein [Fodinibius salsisoli]